MSNLFFVAVAGTIPAPGAAQPGVEAIALQDLGPRATILSVAGTTNSMRVGKKLALLGLATMLVVGSVRATVGADDASASKARSLVEAAINMTDSQQAVKLLWQASDIDPTLEDPYVYLGLYYNSRSQFDQVVSVYKKLIKYQPTSVSAYLNIGEAYMSFTPPKAADALPYYQKAYQLDQSSAFAALRLGEVYAQMGNREQAAHYLNLAAANSSKNPAVAAEARKILGDLGAM
jgi:tetratricopeptide (TPR) repeat protein